MESTKIDIQKGIRLHTIKTDKFKTDLISVFLTTELNKENVTKNALISLLLRRGTRKIISQQELSKKLEEMYGGWFDCGLDKMGNNQVLKFYIETIDDKFIPQSDEKVWKEALELILEIALDPYVENEAFKEEYFEQEKNTLKQLIEARKDNKAQYALNRCIEEMFKGEPFGIYKYGNLEDVDKIDNKELYNYYKELVQSCKIDIFFSGNIENEEEITQMIKDNETIQKLKEREPKYVPVAIEEKKKVENEKVVEESMEVAQGKLVLGLNINIDDEEQKYAAIIYNAILGGTANSKMFQNVREKAHLAYVASSSYLRHKNTIFVNSGIEIANYEKALKIIKEQIEDMKKGEFTEEDVVDAKKIVVEGMKNVYDEQDTQIVFYFGQEISKQKEISVEENIQKIEEVKKEDILKVANEINIDTIYFLKN